MANTGLRISAGAEQFKNAPNQAHNSAKVTNLRAMRLVCYNFRGKRLTINKLLHRQKHLSIAHGTTAERFFKLFIEVRNIAEPALKANI